MPIIEIKKLSKKYTIYHEGKNHVPDTLKEAISQKGRQLISKLNPFHQNTSSTNQQTAEEFWALKDIDFTINEGDKVGIIGRNGAGKSTLLKILTRIVEPTTGQVRMKGRIASLLEVGTGFHPDLSGRENIFLNGAILGMSNKEIKNKFDEIVAFAEIEKFLDTPVKRYSSGMYMRLGFSIAAHLETDILIVDEVLAVGDAQFQEKCIKKLNIMGSKGRTILFVSHNIEAVKALCNRCIYLENGMVKASGDVEHCANQYMTHYPEAKLFWQGIVGDEHIRFTQASVKHVNGTAKDFFSCGDQAALELEYEIVKPHDELILGMSIWNSRHQLVVRSRFNDSEQYRHTLKTPGRYRALFPLDAGLFHEGDYILSVDSSLSQKKAIVTDNIRLKFPVYKDQDVSGFKPDCEGISLGNKWNLL